MAGDEAEIGIITVILGRLHTQRCPRLMILLARPGQPDSSGT